MTRKTDLGSLGEDLAVGYLVGLGYKVLFRNLFVGRGDEIDIIALGRKGLLIFVEVKTMRISGSSGLSPEDNLTKRKLKKMYRSAEIFANENPELLKNDIGYRLDLIAVSIDETGKSNFRHYENV